MAWLYSPLLPSAPLLTGATSATALPGVGLVVTVGQIPVSTGVVSPSVGAVGVNTTTTGPIIYVAPEAINTHVPGLYTELKQSVAGAGLVVTVGQLPTVTDISESPAATPGVGLVTAAGLIPGEYLELKQAVDVGLVTTAGQIPTMLKNVALLPAVGLVATVEQIPGESLELKQGVAVGLAVTGGQIPGESLELKQGVGVGLAVTGGLVPAALKDDQIGPTSGLATMAGLAPTLTTELKQAVDVGLAIVQGQIPAYGVAGEATALPGVGLVTTVGQIPSESLELKQAISVGTASAAGLVPGEYLELKQGVDVGLAIAQGLVPTIQSGVDVVATITPDVGLVATVELTPTLAVEVDKPRGHVTTKRRRRGKTPVYDLSQTAVAVVKLPYELTPQPIAYFDPAPVAIAGIDTSAVATIDGQLAVLEEQKRLTARRRREEEEVITLWLRAA